MQLRTPGPVTGTAWSAGRSITSQLYRASMSAALISCKPLRQVRGSSPFCFSWPVDKRCITGAREQFRDAGLVVAPLRVQNCALRTREITQCQKSKRGRVTYSS